MAKYCRQCSLKLFGVDNRDFVDVITEEMVTEEDVPIVTCEGCGQIKVDPQGNCITKDCLEQHGLQD